MTSFVAPAPVFVAFETLTCGECGVPFAMTRELYQRRVNDHQNFYCPNGHCRYFVGKTEADRLREELAAQERATKAAQSRADTERRWRVDAENATRKTAARLRGTKSVVTRMRRRIIAGSCVCCSRKFKDLEAHMKKRHPAWNPDRAAEALSTETPA